MGLFAGVPADGVSIEQDCVTRQPRASNGGSPLCT
jgi:hypothetical protein